MRNPFKSKYKVTQEFGNNPDYYKQFGLAGHEGIDLVPTGSQLDVLALEDGVVVRDDDVAGDPRTDAYGINCTIWHPTLNKATQYCHLSSNEVADGQKVTKGQRIGFMGDTGNTQGAHLHLNLFETDSQGMRLNKNNGYLGGIDPKPWLEADDPQVDVYTELDRCRIDRDNHWNDLQAIKNSLVVVGDYSLTNVMARIDGLLGIEAQQKGKDQQITDAQKRIAELEQKVKSLTDDHDALVAANGEDQTTIQKQGFQIKTLQDDLQTLKNSVVTPSLSGWGLIVKGIVSLFGK